MANKDGETKECPHCTTDIPKKAKKCPHCRTDLRNWFRRHPIFTLLLIILLTPFLLSSLADDTGKQKPQSRQKVLTQDQKERLINNLAGTFCKTRTKSGVVYSNLDDYSKMLEGKDVKPRNVIGTPPSQESCTKIAKLCLLRWSQDDCQNLAERKIWIGMSKDQLILVSGTPNDINNTTGSWGIHSQWVYGDFGPYIYLEGKNEDQLVVTSWQD